MNKFMKFFCAFAVLFIIFLSGTAYSHDYHKSVTSITNTTIINAISAASSYSAAQCHFDGGSFDLQLCGGVGFSDGKEAFTFGVGQKFGDFLINATETIENGKSSRGLGINWKVKIK